MNLQPTQKALSPDQADDRQLTPAPAAASLPEMPQPTPPTPSPDPSLPDAAAVPAAAPAPDPLPALDAPTTQAPALSLAQREAALAIRERQFEAREHLLALGLPRDILPHLDYSSDEALANSLKVATLAAGQAAAGPGAPPAARPPAPQFATYVDRARLFQEDPVLYRDMVNQQQPG